MSILTFDLTTSRDKQILLEEDAKAEAEVVHVAQGSEPHLTSRDMELQCHSETESEDESEDEDIMHVIACSLCYKELGFMAGPHDTLVCLACFEKPPPSAWTVGPPSSGDAMIDRMNAGP